MESSLSLENVPTGLAFLAAKCNKMMCSTLWQVWLYDVFCVCTSRSHSAVFLPQLLLSPSPAGLCVSGYSKKSC